MVVPGLEERAHLFSKLSSVEQITLGELAYLPAAPFHVPCTFKCLPMSWTRWAGTPASTAWLSRLACRKLALRRP